MSEKTFNNVKITSSFDIPEAKENLVSGETIGKHFGKNAKHMGDESIHHTVDNALSSTSTNPVQNKVVNAALNSKTQRFSLGAVSAKTWTIFATTPNTNTVGNVSATLLITDADNVASASQGAWIVQVSNRGSKPTMKVVTLIQPTTNAIAFGCYAVESQSVFKFGVCVNSYRGTTNITVLGNTGVTVGSILSTTSEPSGWTAITPTKYATSSLATTSAAGLMSASDKTKLDGVATGATKNQVLTFTTDIAVSDWGTDTDGGYSCTKTVTGLLSIDIPEVDVVLSTDRAAAMTQLTALECLCDGTVVTGDDTVKLWCYNNKPTVAITVRLKVVR